MKKTLSLIIVLLLSAMLLSSCFKNEAKYDYNMDDYVTLPDYRNFTAVVEMDDIYKAIDNYILQNAKDEYKITAGDNVSIEIVEANVVNHITADDKVIDQKGDAIPDLTNKEVYIANVGAGSYALKLEEALIGHGMDKNMELKVLLPDDFGLTEYQGKDVYLKVSVTRIDKEVKLGDIVNVKYVGYKLDDKGEILKDDKGEAQSFNKSDSFNVYLGAQLAIDDFENGIVGMKIGETKTIDATFPDDYSAEDLKGQKVKFEITVNKLLVKPVYNDDFVKSNYSFETTQKFEEYLIEQSIKSQITSNLNKNSTVISYPKQEYKDLEDRVNEHPEYFDDNYSTYKNSLDFDTYLKLAYDTTLDDYVKSLILYEMVYYSISQKENIEVTQEEIDSKRNYYITLNYYTIISNNTSVSQSDAFAYAQQYVNAQFDDESLKEDVMFEKVENLLYEVTKVEKKPATHVSYSVNNSVEVSDK